MKIVEAKGKGKGTRGGYRSGSPRYARGRPTETRRPGKTGEGGPSFIVRLGRSVLRFFGRGLKLAAIGAATVASLAVISALLVAAYLYISKSDYFSVKRVTISGISHITREEVLDAAGLNQPANILTFDPVAAEEALSTLPWLSEVKVSRQMPDTVTIAVKEHSPKLLVSLGRLYYLNDRGEPFKELDPGESPNLPIVSGFSEDELLSPGPYTRKAIGEVFWLVDTLAARNDEFRLDNVSEINYDPVRGLTMFTKSNGLEVKIGFGAYEEKFRRLGRVLAHLKLRGKYEGLVYLNLEASPRVTVRYNERFTPTDGSALTDLPKSRVAGLIESSVRITG